MKLSFRRIILTLVVAAMLVVAAQAFAAPGGVLLGYSLNETDCYVDITAQVEDAGFYAINMWDDGNFRAGAGTDVPSGGILSVRFTIGGPILQGAAGIGVYLQEIAGPTATITYASDGNAQLWSDAVATACVNAGYTWGAVASLGTSNVPCPYPLPAGSAVYNVPAGALTYFEANADTYTGFNLPPGTWYISEFTGDFAKVWIACQASPVYIPVANVIR